MSRKPPSQQHPAVSYTHLDVYKRQVLGLTVSVIQILGNYGVLEGARWVVIFLGILFFAELFLGWLIYRQMDKKY